MQRTWSLCLDRFFTDIAWQKAVIGRLTCLATSPTQMAAATVPSRTPSSCPRKTETVYWQ